MNIVSTSGLDWFRSAKFGLFIHWGLYSVPAGEWRGKKVSSIGEYLMHAEYIPISEYETIAAQFDPAGFNAREWVGRAEEAGMRYLVFTAKHHDGFAMYRSKVDRFNVVEATPFGRDVVAELAEACRESPVKLGVYYSHCVDWHEPHGGNLPGDLKDDGIVWGNDWDFPKGTPEGFDLYLRNKVEPQLTEPGSACARTRAHSHLPTWKRDFCFAI